MFPGVLVEKGRFGLLTKGKIPDGSEFGLVDIRLLHFLIMITLRMILYKTDSLFICTDEFSIIF